MQGLTVAKTPKEVLEAQVKNLGGITKRFSKAKKSEILRLAKKLVVEVIKKRSRAGRSQVGGDFDALSDKYMETRRRYKKNLSKHTSPSKSNVTATGQMIDAIFAAIDSSGRVSVDVKDTKRKKELTGKRGRLTNQAVAALVETNGRLFLGLTEEEEEVWVDALTEELSKYVREELSRK